MNKKTSKHPGLDRRTFLQIIAVAGAAGAGWTLGKNREKSVYKVVHKSQPMMGTVVNLTLYGPEQSVLENALLTTIDRMLTLEKQLSRHDQTSQVAALNRNGNLAAPTPDLLNVLTLANFINARTRGAFDVTVLPLVTLQQNTHAAPDKVQVKQALQQTGFHNMAISDSAITFKKPGMGITLDGIGKGYIVDQGVAVLKENGFANAYVEAGGDLMVSGSKPGKTPWRIGIRNPRPEQSPGKMIVLETGNQAVATSGDYMQAYDTSRSRHHIVNPKTGYSPPELASATITAPTVALADGLATAAMVMGSKKTLALLETMPRCEGYLIDKHLNHFKSSKFRV
jgi:thiamine biosynthesis lipoprotein